jgi:phage terminase small subunit
VARKANGHATEAQRRFVDEYLIDLNGTRAYRAAYPGVSYAAARTNAGRLLALPAVAREVKAGRAAQRRRTRVTADRVLNELAAVAFSDIGDLFDHNGRPVPVHQLDPITRSAVAAVSIGRANGPAGVVSETFHVRFWDKLRALELLARHMGFDRPPPPLTTVLDALPEHVRAEVVAALAASP